jgi:pimeloyl-[acyl-carrier protein] methyl ester esterase
VSVAAKSTLIDGLHLLYSNNLLPDLNECKVPALFLGGSRDRTIRPESFDQAASCMPDSKVASIPGAGHVPFISHEEEFLQIIRGFLHKERLA